MHCVTTWSKFDTTFEGIALRELLKFVEINECVKYIKIYGYYNGDRFGYCANLPLEPLLGEERGYSITANPFKEERYR